MSCKFGENYKPLEKWAKPNLLPDVTPQPANFFGDYFRQNRQNFLPFFLPIKLAKGGERVGWIAVWSSSLTGWKKSAQFRTRIVSDVLLLSYLRKIGLSLIVEAGQALAVLYSKARLYKGPRLAGLSQSATTRLCREGFLLLPFNN